jgi:hypothetical protein
VLRDLNREVARDEQNPTLTVTEEDHGEKTYTNPGERRRINASSKY